MTNNDYLWPGIAAIALAVMTPLYWIYEIGTTDFGMSLTEYATNINLNFADWVFLLTGVLSIYVYVNFRRILHDHHNFTVIDMPVLLLIVTSLVYYGGLFIVEVVGTLDGESMQELILGTSVVLGAGGIVLFGVLDILIGVLLLRNSNLLPDLLKMFAIVTLIQGIFEVTLIFSFAALLIFPIAAVILAVYFLRKPEMIEVV